MRKENVIQIWKNRNAIMEGIKNSIFVKDDVEQIAEERMSICRRCPSKCYTEEADGCVIPGTQPCCDVRKGGCGCSLKFKTRSLSTDCPFNHWKAVVTDDEEFAIKEKLGITNE